MQQAAGAKTVLMALAAAEPEALMHPGN